VVQPLLEAPAIWKFYGLHPIFKLIMKSYTASIALTTPLVIGRRANHSGYEVLSMKCFHVQAIIASSYLSFGGLSSAN